MKFDFFKKKENEALDAPKSLPELAKDVIEPVSGDVPVIQKKDSTIQEVPVEKKPDEYKIPTVPASSDVPRLDLNLIRSANIHLPDMPQRLEPQEQIVQAPIPIATINREPLNIINLPKIALSQRDMQRNIYINKGKALFDDLESAIASNKTDIAKNMINNIMPLLYEYHEIESMNDSDRISELKDLEKFWTMLQKRNYAVKSMIDSIESDILRKSNGLLNNADNSKRIVSNQMSSSSSILPSSQVASSSSYSATSSTPSFQPMFVPIIKNSSNNLSSNNSNSNDANFIEPVMSATPVYVQPYERFYFKDGKIASSLKDLYYVLNDISDDTFYHHVSVERNDFSNWIKDVLKEYSLAKEISNIYSRRDLIEFLKNRL